jgi:hypothetical protein
MQLFNSRAALLAATGLFSMSALAKDEPPAADPKAVEVIRELGLMESTTALRDQKGWKPPKRVLLSTIGPHG